MGSSELIKCLDQFKTNFEINKMWNDFEEGIKHDNRYFANPEFEKHLETLLRLKEKISSKDTFYRARKINPVNYSDMKIQDFNNEDSGIHGFDNEKMGAPPKSVATSGRANPTGISYLYIASNPETACAEIRLQMFDLISVSKFQPIKELNIVNLKCNSFKDYEEPEKTKMYCFVKKVQESLSMPVYIQSDIEYAPSQYIAAYLHSNNIDGIKYGSMYNTNHDSYNLVIFNPENLKCIYDLADVYTCAAKSISFQNISIPDYDVVTAETNLDTCKKGDIEQINSALQNHIGQKKTKNN